MILVALLSMAILFWAYSSFAAGSGSRNAYNGNNSNIANGSVDNAALAQAMKADDLAQDNAQAVNEQMAADDANINGNANVVDGLGDVMPAPMGYRPYAFVEDNAYFENYPDQINGNSTMGNGQPNPYDLNLSALMPASWRGTQACDGQGAGIEDEVGSWSRYAPSKDSFNNYITAAGSARLGLSTRTKNVLGIPNLLRSSPALPMSASNIPFGDSSIRQDLVFSSLGMYPSQVQC